VPDFPRLRSFPLLGSTAEILYQAMDMERGAYHFYREVLAHHKEAAFARFIDMLARAEEGHARLIYGYYVQEIPDAPPFEDLYGSLSGEVLEGGQSLAAMRRLLESRKKATCIDIVELAITIEYAAYDLYRNMADYFQGSTREAAFLDIAQAEKEHMRIAAEALACCEE
jgi:rubrerythrin